MLKLGLNSQLIPKQDAEGTDNTFDDGLESPLYNLAGDGKSEQVTTTGKQLFNALAITNEDIIVTDNGKTITMPVVSDGNGGIITNVTLQELCPTLQVGDVVYLNFERNLGLVYNNHINLVGSDTIWYVNTSHEITQSELENTIYLYGNRFIEGETKQCILTNFRITKNQSDDFEYYTGGQPSPSPDYEQPINSIEGSLEFACNGRNLLPNNASSQTINDVIFIVKDDGSVIVNGTATARANLFLFANNENPIKLIPGNYSLKSGKTSGGSFLQIEVKNLLGESRYITSSSTPNNNVVINEGDVLVAGYIGLDQGQTATNDHIYPVFQKGATSAKYEPYVQPNEVTFNLNEEKLRSVGTVKDELVVDLDTGDYYKVENVTEDILDGDENWEFSAFTNATILSVFLNRGDMKPTSRFQMDNFKYSTEVSVATNYEYCSTGGNSIRIGIDKTRLVSSDIVGFKQWLSTHNTVVDFALKAPTTKKLGTLSTEDLAKLKTFKGYNNVTVNTNLGLMNIRFTYGLDIKKYVDNKIAELSAQLIKGE